MDLKKWFDSVESDIRDDESLIVSTWTGETVTYKSKKEEMSIGIMAKLCAQTVMYMEDIDDGFEYARLKWSSKQVIVFDCYPYNIIFEGQRFTVEYLQKLIKKLK